MLWINGEPPEKLLQNPTATLNLGSLRHLPPFLGNRAPWTWVALTEARLVLRDSALIASTPQSPTDPKWIQWAAAQEPGAGGGTGNLPFSKGQGRDSRKQ